MEKNLNVETSNVLDNRVRKEEIMARDLKFSLLLSIILMLVVFPIAYYFQP
ncbi:hypothetical protein [Ammoniphilus sp. CFH 90114]|uniref:hypothetical protein n=1 Tax=Ammoniphilus sp. CFH 90114 TaxID=2493665 RepID=UPI0013E93B06|nr:hypothetical protein [Ammoniphilus sp. CFH 90114]